jgi:hypothetical protein
MAATNSEPAPVKTVLWSPLMSLAGGVLVGTIGIALGAPFGILRDLTTVPVPFNLPIVVGFWGFVAGFVWGVISFTVLGTSQITVVNPLRVYRVPVEQVERIFDTTLRWRARTPVLAVSVRGRRRRIPFWGAPLSYYYLIPPLRRRLAARLLAVHSWSVAQGIGPLQLSYAYGGFTTPRLTDEARRRASVRRNRLAQRHR